MCQFYKKYYLCAMTNEVDVRENDILNIDQDLLSLLLFDHTTRKNIFWATTNCANYGIQFYYGDEIIIEYSF